MAQQHLADLIRSYMDVRGWNQAEAARACGFTDSQMSSLLTRERKGWLDPETVVKLRTGLGIPAPDTVDAVAQDIGVGPLFSESLRISDDPDIRATAQVIATLPPQDRRTLSAMVRAFVDNSDDTKS